MPLPTLRRSFQPRAVQVRPPLLDKETGLFKEGANLISYIQPAQNKELVAKLQEKKMNVIGACAKRRAVCVCVCVFVCFVLF